MAVSGLLLLLLLLSFSGTLYTIVDASTKGYIVYFGGYSDADVSLEDVKGMHHEFLAPFFAGKEEAKESILHSYQNINAFAARLTDEQASQIENHPSVLSVIPNGLKQLHTTRTWEFMGLSHKGVVPESSLWKKARYGEDVIIGHLDSGVWPEHASFSDEGMGPVPKRWKGFCRNNTKEGVSCNRKIIGARYFNKGFVDIVNDHFPELLKNVPRVYSARDSQGHGSHTLSTVAGRFSPGASYYGMGSGTAVGGSPNARVATYKICYPLRLVGCTDLDILSAFDAAISDGVDLITLSVGGDPRDYLKDSIAIGSLHAVLKGIPVMASGGNSGPILSSVTNGAPWLFTIAASTLDRTFSNTLRLGNKVALKGSNNVAPIINLQEGMYPIILANQAKRENSSDEEARICSCNSYTTFDPTKVKGKIVVCLRGNINPGEQGYCVKQFDGIGIVIVDSETDVQDPNLEVFPLPATHLSYKESRHLYAYLNSTKSPKAFIERTITSFNWKPAPKVTDFSSRGPYTIDPQIIKPDITAPGDNVIASYTLDDIDPYNRTRNYEIMSGTSMSCPHVAGVMGLVKNLNPAWSPAMLRSALMTTARVRDDLREPMQAQNKTSSPYTTTKATPFDYGSGHIRPNAVADPGLVYDITPTHYVKFLCSLYNNTAMATLLGKNYTCKKSITSEQLNYPSITFYNYSSSSPAAVAKRELTNVGPTGTYKARILSPPGVVISVKPRKLHFSRFGEMKKFHVKMKITEHHDTSIPAFGGLIWSDGTRHVRSPIAIFSPIWF